LDLTFEMGVFRLEGDTQGCTKGSGEVVWVSKHLVEIFQLQILIILVCINI